MRGVGERWNTKHKQTSWVCFFFPQLVAGRPGLPAVPDGHHVARPAVASGPAAWPVLEGAGSEHSGRSFQGLPSHLQHPHHGYLP